MIPYISYIFLYFLIILVHFPIILLLFNNNLQPLPIAMTIPIFLVHVLPAFWLPQLIF